MTVGEWQPSKPATIDVEKLRQYVGLFDSADPENLALSMSQEQMSTDKRLMSHTDWSVAEQLTDSELESLIRFFTLAEGQLTDWHGGKHSPVIALVKHLKQRSSFDPELRKWVRANTENRYLPNGAIL